MAQSPCSRHRGPPLRRRFSVTLARASRAPHGVNRGWRRTRRGALSRSPNWRPGRL